MSTILCVMHHKFDVTPPLLERLPVKILYHLGGAACGSVVTIDESGCSTLYTFCGVRIPC